MWRCFALSHSLSLLGWHWLSIDFIHLLFKNVLLSLPSQIPIPNLGHLSSLLRSKHWEGIDPQEEQRDCQPLPGIIALWRRTAFIPNSLGSPSLNQKPRDCVIWRWRDCVRLSFLLLTPTPASLSPPCHKPMTHLIHSPHIKSSTDPAKCTCKTFLEVTAPTLGPSCHPRIMPTTWFNSTP